MDPVSRLLVERERSLPRLAPWIAMAVLGHGVCVAAAIWLGRETSVRPGHLPSVSVRLVQPQPAPKAASDEAPGRRATVPEPMAEPKVPEPKAPEPEPEPRPPEPEIKASDQAMAAPEPVIEPTAVPTTPPGSTATADAGAQGSPAADNRSGGGRRSGLSIGGEGAGAPSGIPSDFQFTYYIDRMLSLIESKWYRPPVPPQTQAQVRFVITKSGRLEGVQLESSSGISSFDRAVLRALYASNPLPPLPPAYRKPSLTVHLTFSE